MLVNHKNFIQNVYTFLPSEHKGSNISNIITRSISYSNSNNTKDRLNNSLPALHMQSKHKQNKLNNKFSGGGISNKSSYNINKKSKNYVNSSNSSSSSKNKKNKVQGKHGVKVSTVSTLRSGGDPALQFRGGIPYRTAANE